MVVYCLCAGCDTGWWWVLFCGACLALCTWILGACLGGFWVLGCVILCNCLVLFAGIGMLFCLVGYGFGCVVCVV